MSVTRIICERCGFVQMHCTCPVTHAYIPLSLIAEALEAASAYVEMWRECENATETTEWQEVVAKLGAYLKETK